MERVGRLISLALPWLVAVFCVLAATDGSPDDPVAVQMLAMVLGAAQGFALLGRRRRPELVTALVIVLGLGYHLLVPDVVIPFAGLIAVGALALLRPPRVSLVGLAGLLTLIGVNLFTTTVADTVFAMVIAVGVWALAEAARNRRVAISEAARRAAGDEQARIARELHDVIAHTVSVIVVQAAAAGDVFDARPDQARAALQSIEEAGRDALGELRRLLGAVRDPCTITTAPQPGLARMADLTEPLRAGGLEVVVVSEGLAAPLPTGVDLSAYRIVQEALTNVVRHARATMAEVTLRYGPDDVEIDIVDDGRPAAGSDASRPGYGLIGMRERAAALGGTLEAGPTAHGGYRVHAVLPLGATR